MAYRKTSHLWNALNDEELEVYKLYHSADILFVKSKYGVSEAEAQIFIEKINAKVKKHQDHESRQMMRGEAINLGMMEAALQGTNEIRVMSNF